MEYYCHNMGTMVTNFTICLNLKYDKTIIATIAIHNSEFYYQYLKGRYYIVNKLPRPAVKDIENHSYCSINNA